MTLTRVNVAGVARLPAFCHATIAGGLVYVSGTLGAKPGLLELVDGGIAAETVQTLRNLEAILAGCGCTFADIVKVNVYLTDMTQFGAMNEAYLSFFGARPAGPDHDWLHRAGTRRRRRDGLRGDRPDLTAVVGTRTFRRGW